MQADGPRPEYRLYTPGQIACAAFFGSVLAGCYLLFRNARNLGRRGWPYVVGAIPLLAVTFCLPQRVAGWLTLSLVFAARGLAQTEYGSALDEHKLRGGALGSNWAVFGVSVASLGLVLGIALVPFLCDEGWAMTHAYQYSPVESVVYRPGVTEETARKVSEVMHEAGLFEGKEEWQVVIRKKGQGFALDLRVKPETWQDPKMLEFGGELAKELTTKLGAPTVVCYLDENDDVQATLEPK